MAQPGRSELTDARSLRRLRLKGSCWTRSTPPAAVQTRR
jgi:hypothetical protein